MQALDESALTHVATYFRALSEPTRLRILNTLRDGEKNVSQITELTGCGQANVSKHLQQLTAAGFISRRKEGTFAYYALADNDVFALCDVMCGRIEADQRERRAALKLAR